MNGQGFSGTNLEAEYRKELDLLVTDGSDFHGVNSPGVEMGDVQITDDLVERLREFKRNK